MRSVLVIAGTSLRRFLRERANLFWVFGFPLMLVLLIGLVFGGGFSPRLGVAGRIDRGLGAELVDTLDDAAVELRRFEDPGELETAVARGSLEAGLVIDERADGVDVRFLVAREEVGAALRPIVSDAIAAVETRARAQRLLVAHGLDEAAAAAVVDAASVRVQPVTVERVTVGEPVFAGLGRFDLGAAQELVLFVFLASLTSASALIQTRQLGISRRMLATPTPVGRILTGEALGRYGIAVFQGLYIVVATSLVFGVRWGSLLAVGIVLAAFAAVGAAAAMLMGALFENDQQAGGMGVLFGLTLAALGGAMVPLEVMPPAMRRIAWLTPHAWALEGIGASIRGAGVDAVLDEVAVLAGFAAVLGAVALMRFKAVLTR